MIFHLEHFVYILALWSFYGCLLGTFVCAVVVTRFYLTNDPSNYDRCFLYMGKVSHTRLKGISMIVTRNCSEDGNLTYMVHDLFTGGATHHFVYPLFFSFIDLEQIQKVGWSLWPIFKLNGGRYTFCSLDEKDHLQDGKKERNDECSRNGKEKTNESLLQSVHSFVKNRTKGTKVLSPGCTTHLMAHLTYFGYCFNPISIFYCLRPEKKTEDKNTSNGIKNIQNIIQNDSVPAIEKNIPTPKTTAIKSLTETKTETETVIDRESSIESIIVEVSNTPWIEQHSYMLDETVENVS